ncbi:MAG: GntP family permease [Chitinophagaceae bacterium]|nr:GntP family permease [Chitinophagaceae bacterium]
MPVSFLQIIISLLAGILLIILLTAKFRIHAFFALLLACFVVGIGVQMNFADIITTAKQGFGHIMQSLGLIIVLGTTLGVILEHTGATQVMASFILKKTGQHNAPAAMGITGFITGLPIFCDSGYIVLSGLNQSLAKRTGTPVAIMAGSLATGLYSVHCLIPPHPGASAAASTIGVEFGKLILYGILIAIPASIAGYYWVKYAGRKYKNEVVNVEATNDKTISAMPVSSAFLPVIVPILLIAVKSFLTIEKSGSSVIVNVFSVLGDPVIALSVGILLSFTGIRNWNKQEFGKLLTDAVEKSGGILVIIGAGGAFGAILAATNIGQHFGNALPLEKLGIFFPFLLTFILKTAQGSSTVAIITAASVIAPLLPALGLESSEGKLLAVLSMGAGSMMISHANDAYFWVITKFSGLEMKTMLHVYSIATLCMGVVALGMVYIVSLFI